VCCIVGYDYGVPALGMRGPSCSRPIHHRGRRSGAALVSRRSNGKDRRVQKRRLKRQLLADLAPPIDERHKGSGVLTSSRPSGPEPGRGRVVSCLGEVNQAGNPLRLAGAKIRYGQELRMATLNVQSLCKPLMHKQVVDYMVQGGLGLVCLQETRVPQTTQYLIDDVTFVLAGGGGDREYAGVAIAMQADIRRAVSGVVVLPGGRLMAISLDLAPRLLTVICAYAPQSARPEDERSDFFEQLAGLVDNAERKGAVILLGDFNARLHGRLRGEEPVIGPHIYGAGVGRILRTVSEAAGRSNRDLLMEMCQLDGPSGVLRIMNTWFRKKDAEKVTFVAPGVDKLPRRGGPWDPASFAELDLCVVPDRWKGLVRDVRSNTKAGLSTDHFPLEVRLALKLRRASQKRHPVVRWDFRAITEEGKTAFDVAVAGCEADVEKAASVEEGWEILRDAVNGALEQHVPRKPAEARRPWIRSGTLELHAHRQALAALGQLKDARELDKMIRDSAKEDRRQWIAEGLKNSLWEPVRQVKKPRQSKVVALVAKGKAYDGRRPEAVYAEHLETVQWGRQAGATREEQRQERTDWSGPPLCTGGNVLDGPITEEELSESIRAAKKGKVPGLDGLPYEAWACLEQGRRSVLRLFNRCWEEERFPEQWKQALVIGIFKKGAAQDPANYRPISLLLTAYKLFGRILAVRLQNGLDDLLRNTQFGFRKGRSTAEPLFIIRRLQDLVHGRKNQALHLIFMDWSQAFDKIDTRCLDDVLRRYGVPGKVRRVTVSLVEDPAFRVSMAGEISEEKR